MRITTFLRWLIFSMVALLFLYQCESNQNVRIIKLGHGLDPTHPVHEAMVYFGERVAEKSADSIQVDIYPSEQLGSEREAIELLQIGSLGITKVSTSPLEGFAPIYKALSLPYLFQDNEHKFRVLEGEIGQRLLSATEEFRFRGLCFYDAGSRSFYTKSTPIRTPDDLTGLKIRTQESATAIDMVRAMGGSPTPISWGELYSALQQGIVDGAENNPPSFYLSHHYEVCEYYTLDEHTAVPDVLIISQVLWEKLTPEEQQIVREAADESAQYQKELWREATEEALEAVQEAGVEVIRPEKEPFQQSVQNLYDSYRNQPEIWNIVQQIMEAGQS